MDVECMFPKRSIASTNIVRPRSVGNDVSVEPPEVMFSDFSLKALISHWDVHLFGPNPFRQTGVAWQKNSFWERCVAWVGGLWKVDF